MDDIKSETTNSFTLMTRADLRNLGIPYSNVHLLRLEKAGKFPQRITLSKNKVAWNAREIYTWLETKHDERKGACHD